MLLKELNYPITSINGVGKKTQAILKKIDITKVSDILEYYPRKYSDRSIISTLEDAISLNEATVKINIVDYRQIRAGKKSFLKIIIHDGKNYGSLVCFNRNFLKNSLLLNHQYYITGKFVYNFGEYQTSSFEYEEADDTLSTNKNKEKIIPVYPLTEGLTQKFLRNISYYLLTKYLNQIEDELPENIIKKRNLLSKRGVIKNIHYPTTFELFFQAKKTLLYEDFFFQQLFLLSRKNKISSIKKDRKKIGFVFKKETLNNLNFELTDYQLNALSEIENDLFSTKSMSRLLQGDVGCGKTIVAILSMLSVVESGEQCAIMSPTEVLAKQHYQTIKNLCDKIGVSVGLLLGQSTKSDKESLLNRLKGGEIKIIVGTHSLFSDSVVYKNLGYAIIDEQHKFGVEQRLMLTRKGRSVDLLLMTATPIPQSLALSLYGDLKLTTMIGKIKGRVPVKTWVIDDVKEKINSMYNWLKTLLDNNGRVIFVYSQIEDSEMTNAKNLDEEYKKLSKVFNIYGCGYIHSKITVEDKDKIIDNFRNGAIKLLATTTVVEVGIDIPDANAIVIENAERYGLSTLHQLRGRVGRNSQQSYMILISKFNLLTDDAKKRLGIIKNIEDGFLIAEKDLLLRGPGDFIGTKQSGLPKLRLSNIKDDLEILRIAKNDSELIFHDDPNLEKTEHLNIKKAFYLRLNCK